MRIRISPARTAFALLGLALTATAGPAQISNGMNMRHGVYARSDVACEQASDATLAAFVGSIYVNAYGWVRAPARIWEAGARTYAGEIPAEGANPPSRTLRIVIDDDSNFTLVWRGTPATHYRYCSDFSDARPRPPSG